MRILCLIDSLNSGGAQRQIVNLALLLHQHGHDVRLLAYHEYNFFANFLESANIPVEVISKRNKLRRLIAITKRVASLNPDVIIAFLKTPSLIAEVSGLVSSHTRIIVSERSGVIGTPPTRAELLRFHLHRFADAVVVNSQNLRSHLAQFAPWLKDKTVLIRNCVNLDEFSPAMQKPINQNIIKILTIGRICPDKNLRNYILAINSLVKGHNKCNLKFYWYGNNFTGDERSTNLATYYHDIKSMIAELHLGQYIHLYEPQEDVVKLYREADIFCLPSVRESCPNVVTEAMACGLPILASRVGDIPFLVKEEENGYLFDPQSPEDIAGTFLRMLNSGEDHINEMRRKSRSYAETICSEKVFLDSYLEIACCRKTDDLAFNKKQNIL